MLNVLKPCFWRRVLGRMKWPPDFSNQHSGLWQARCRHRHKIKLIATVGKCDALGEDAAQPSLPSEAGAIGRVWLEHVRRITRDKDQTQFVVLHCTIPRSGAMVIQPR